MRYLLPVSLIAILVVASVLTAAAQSTSVAEDLKLLSDAFEERRLVRSVAIGHTLSDRIQGLWIHAVKSALPEAPAGWTAEAPNEEYRSASAAGPMFTRTYRKGEAGAVEFRIDLDPNAYDKPHGGNLAWIRDAHRRVLRDDRRSEVEFAGRQAFLDETGRDEPGLVLGLLLTHGASFGVVTSGEVTKEELLGTFGSLCDLAGIEKLIWRRDSSEPTVDTAPREAAALIKAKRFGEAYDILAHFQSQMGRQAGERFQGMLPAVPEGWTAGDVEVRAAGASRVYHRSEGKSVEVSFGWAMAPNVNGHLSAFRDPARRKSHESVVTVGVLPVLLSGYRQYGGTVECAYAFFSDGDFRLEATGKGLAREAWLEPLLGGLDPVRIEKKLAKLW